MKGRYDWGFRWGKRGMWFMKLGAGQYDATMKRGAGIDFQNNGTANNPCHIRTLWRRIVHDMMVAYREYRNRDWVLPILMVKHKTTQLFIPLAGGTNH